MDSNVLIAGIGVFGTLSGAIVGAWLNPKMREMQENRALKQFIKNCNQLEKLIILNAYRTIFLPIYDIEITNISEFNNDDEAILNNLLSYCNFIEVMIQKFQAEGKIFVNLKEIWHQKGYIISLHSNVKNFINNNPQIKDNLIKETKALIANEIYPHYKLMLKDSIFSKIDKSIIYKYVSFMNNIGVFGIYNKDLSHLNLNNPKSFLTFEKREFHPEFGKK